MAQAEEWRASGTAGATAGRVRVDNHIAGFSFNNRRGWRRQRRGFVVVVADYDDVVRPAGAQVPARRSMAAMVRP